MNSPAAVAFKRLAEPVLGKMLQPAQASTDEVLAPYLKAGHVTWQGLNLPEALPEMWVRESNISELHPEVGDLLICEGGEVGRASIVDAALKPSTIIQNSLHLVRPGQRADPRYLKYALEHVASSGWLDIVCNKATIAHLTVDKLRELQIPFQLIKDQKRIANFLDDKMARIDALISEKERLQAAVIELRTARIWSAVTGQDSEHRQVVQDTPWSPHIPKHWKVTPVGRFARLQRGFDLPDESRTHGDIAVMSGGGISGWHDVARTKGPGVVTGRYGTIGVLHYVKADFWPLNTSLFVDDFFGNNPKYAYYVLSFLPWDMLGGKSAVPGVNRNDVHPLLVGVPPRAEQDQIVSRLDAQFAEFDRLATHCVDHIARLREYRSSLISAAVTGQLDVGSA